MKSGTRVGKADQIMVALLEHGSIEKASAALGVSDVTVWRWLQRPEFQEAYRRARREAFSRSVARLQHASSAAVSTSERIGIEPLRVLNATCVWAAVTTLARSC